MKNLQNHTMYAMKEYKVLGIVPVDKNINFYKQLFLRVLYHVLYDSTSCFFKIFNDLIITVITILKFYQLTLIGLTWIIRSQIFYCEQYSLHASEF